ALANLPSLGINIATFVNSPAAGSARTGYSVAGVGNVLGGVVPNGSFSGDVAIGAPSATVGGNINTGAVYVIPGSFLASVQTQTILLQNVGQGTVPGVIFTGVASSDQAGFSVAGAGDVDGAITSTN
ncbi:MAG TPA: hypothetical protein VKP69_16930, partial [Isosphaeraceae bacterium]|nr:hypothetical protein [Isosphaeraceae bacterium]